MKASKALDAELDKWLNNDIMSELFKLQFFQTDWIDLWWHMPSNNLVKYMHSRGLGCFKRTCHEGSDRDDWIWYPNKRNEKVKSQFNRATDLMLKLTNKIEAIGDDMQPGDKITISYYDHLRYDEADAICGWLELKYPNLRFMRVYGAMGGYPEFKEYKGIQMYKTKEAED